MTRKMKKFWLFIGLGLFVSIAIPLSYLGAKTISLEREIQKLRRAYPQFTEEEIAVVELVKQAQQSVVSVVIRKEVFSRGERLLDLGNGFQITVPGELESQGKQIIGQGSGFVIGKDGLIVTNKHVISDKNAEYQAVFNDGRQFDVKVVARDPFNDVALLKIVKPPKNLRSLALSDSKKLYIGQTVIAIGNALGEFQNTVTKGVISAKNRSILATDENAGQTERLVKIIQTDAAINPGNSGGPLLNTIGEVIGINTAVNRGAENIGFAIPAEDITFVLQSYRKNGRIVRPFLGIRYAMINAEVQKKLSLPYDRGVILTGDNGTSAVIAGSPAYQTGLAEGDIILEINGVKLDENADLTSLIRDFEVGQTVNLLVWKKSLGQEATLQIILAEMK